MQRIGLISDTHGLLRPTALAFLRDCDRIVHVGDLCEREVLDTLARIGPVVAVRGNNDRGAWAEAIAVSEIVQIEEVFLYVIHDIAELDIDPVAAGVHIVVHGHSHKPSIDERDGVLYINPGSAGPRRFKLPISVGELRISGAMIAPRLVTLRG